MSILLSFVIQNTRQVIIPGKGHVNYTILCRSKNTSFIIWGVTFI